MKTITPTTPRLYVGTYAKYSSGSIAGAWLDLEDYSDKEEFYEACAELHKDEKDPEFMFQDFEGFPKDLYSESEIDGEIWEWINLEEEDRKLCAMFTEATGADLLEALASFQDSFYGTADSPADFAENLAEECGEVPETASWIVIDWEASWNCNLRHDFIDVYDTETGSYYFFNRNW